MTFCHCYIAQNEKSHERSRMGQERNGHSILFSDNIFYLEHYFKARNGTSIGKKWHASYIKTSQATQND